MPEARWEWILFSLGVVITGALLALIVLDRGRRAPESRPVALTQRPTTVAAPPATTVRATTTTTATAPATTTQKQAAPAPGQAVRLRLTARADTWLSVRPVPGGRVLYQGTLPAGASRTFSGDRFEVRFGAAANVSATLNGKPLALPGGTYSVTVGESGLGPRSA
ncbi:MAG TPA: DUF4115 domain-containing protein [Gaiellaceae bacterium]|nr:DUF4115 domain-containing protein [Gaiellaceae bacterium]